MMCFRDMTFCSAPCLTDDCPRKFTAADRVAAEQWWGGPDAPVAFGNRSKGCADFKPAPLVCEAAK